VLRHEPAQRCAAKHNGDRREVTGDKSTHHFLLFSAITDQKYSTYMQLI
jgi:hypothetical protein